jgi:hypothetical protein
VGGSRSSSSAPGQVGVRASAAHPGAVLRSWGLEGEPLIHLEWDLLDPELRQSLCREIGVAETLATCPPARIEGRQELQGRSVARGLDVGPGVGENLRDVRALGPGARRVGCKPHDAASPRMKQARGAAQRPKRCRRPPPRGAGTGTPDRWCAAQGGAALSNPAARLAD